MADNEDNQLPSTAITVLNQDVQNSLQPVQEGLEDDPDVDTLHRYQSLEAGQYWKAKVDKDRFYAAGEVLLVTSIDWVDNKPHTVHMAFHPSRVTEFNKGFKILTKDFLSAFDFEPDAEAIRQRELMAIQEKVAELQTYLVNTQADPVKFAGVIAKEIAEPLRLTNQAPNTVSEGMEMMMMGGDLAAIKQSANHQIKVAEATAKWISERVTEISSTVNSMMPYFSEKATVALARTGDVQNQVKKIMRGIESLDLYVGTHVHVETLNSGESAPAEEKLLLLQRKLFMSRELAVHVDIDADFDFTKRELFIEYLTNNPTLRDQILPSKRCVVLIGVTDKNVGYSDDAVINNQLNIENLRSFLLVRNGENIHAVYSPVASHRMVDRLFPLRDETDKVFQGYDGRNITFEDLDYTRKLDEHESMALHYKRFLILLCGLDHRLDLFGKFYPGQKDYNFISQEFQASYFHFAEEDQAYTLSAKQHLEKPERYIHNKNKLIQSGSRVLCVWNHLINEKSAPSYYKSDFGKRESNTSVAIAYERDGQVFVDCPLKGGKHKSVKVNIRVFDRNEHETSGYIVLDRVDPEIIHRYIHEREHQPDHLIYMRLFKRVEKYLIEERAMEAQAREYLREIAIAGNLCELDNVSEVIDTTIANWRGCNRGKDLPSVINNRFSVSHDAILEHVYFAASKGQQTVEAIQQYFSGLGEKVIRISMTGQCNMLAYLAPNAEDKKGVPYHPWVKRISVTVGKNGISTTNDKYLMIKDTLQEVKLYESEDIRDYLSLPSPRIDREEYLEAIYNVTKFTQAMGNLGNPDDLVVDYLTQNYISLRQRLSTKMVHEPKIAIPFAVIKAEDGSIRYLSMVAQASSVLLKMHEKAKADGGKEMVYHFASLYANKSTRIKEANQTIARSLIGLDARNFRVCDSQINITDPGMFGMILTNDLYWHHAGRNGDFSDVKYGVEDNLTRFLEAAKSNTSIQVLYAADITGADKAAGIDRDYPEFPMSLNAMMISPENTPEYKWIEIKPYDQKNTETLFAEEFLSFMKQIRTPEERFGRSRHSKMTDDYGTVFSNKAKAIEMIRKVHPDIQFIEHGDKIYCSPDDPLAVNNPDLNYLDLRHNAQSPKI